MWRSSVNALLLLLLVAIAGTTYADQLQFARFELSRATAPGTYALSVRLPIVAGDEDEVRFPEHCREVSRDRQVIGAETHLILEFKCEETFGVGDEIVVPWGEDGGVLTSALKSGGDVPVMLHGDEGRLALPLVADAAERRPVLTIAAEYTQLGVIHILEGLDHLAFVLCLCLLTRGARLLLLVTAFTIGHSISLALSFLEVVSIPVPPVEATIALSIAFMAREALLAKRSVVPGSHDRGRHVAVVASFGLLHGLGFASVLGELGVAPSERIAGLVFFNVGVEIGQLLFVAIVVGLMSLARLVRVDTPLHHAALFGVGALGVFWTLERVVGFVA